MSATYIPCIGEPILRVVRVSGMIDIGAEEACAPIRHRCLQGVPDWQ